MYFKVFAIRFRCVFSFSRYSGRYLQRSRWRAKTCARPGYLRRNLRSRLTARTQGTTHCSLPSLQYIFLRCVHTYYIKYQYSISLRRVICLQEVIFVESLSRSERHCCDVYCKHEVSYNYRDWRYSTTVYCEHLGDSSKIFSFKIVLRRINEN